MTTLAHPLEVLCFVNSASIPINHLHPLYTDPHMVLFDGSHFEFQKFGAYELVNSIGAVVQADTQPCW